MKNEKVKSVDKMFSIHKMHVEVKLYSQLVEYGFTYIAVTSISSFSFSKFHCNFNFYFPFDYHSGLAALCI